MNASAIAPTASTRVVHRSTSPADGPGLPHFYRELDGWFDFENVYAAQVEHARDGDHFVEVGAWLGKSTAFLAVEILNSGKRIRLDVVDTWAGSPLEMLETGSENDMARLLRDDPEFAYRTFVANTQPIASALHIRRMPSTVAAERYADRSLDFVFIDADHAYESVRADIRAWYPKVKLGGVLAGHDFGWPPLERAVREELGARHDILVVQNDPAATWMIAK